MRRGRAPSVAGSASASRVLARTRLLPLGLVAAACTPEPPAASVDAGMGLDAGVTGCAPAPAGGTWIVCGRRITDMAEDDHALYWAEWGDAVDRGSVMALPHGGLEPVELAAEQSEPVGLAQSQAQLFWTNPPGGQVRAVAKVGGNVSTLTTGEARPYGIVVHGEDVYFGNFFGGEIRRVDQAGGAAVDMFATGGGANRLVEVGGALFWTEPNSHRVVTGQLSTPGQWQVLAAERPVPVGIAADEAHLYWTEFESGSVVRAAHDGSGLTVLSPTGTRASATSPSMSNASTG